LTNKTMEMPEIKPGKPIVIRMSGKWEEFNINTTILRKRKWHSDVMVTRWYDNSIAIASRTCSTCDIHWDNRGEGVNRCRLTPVQMKVVNYILNYDFDKGK